MKEITELDIAELTHTLRLLYKTRGKTELLNFIYEMMLSANIGLRVLNEELGNEVKKG